MARQNVIASVEVRLNNFRYMCTIKELYVTNYNSRSVCFELITQINVFILVLFNEALFTDKVLRMKILMTKTLLYWQHRKKHTRYGGNYSITTLKIDVLFARAIVYNTIVAVIQHVQFLFSITWPVLFLYTIEALFYT